MIQEFSYSEETLLVLDDILSSIICCSGEGRDPESRVSRESLINRLKVLVSVNECHGFYYIVLGYLDRLIRLQSIDSNLEIELSNSGMESHLKVNIVRLVKDKAVALDTLLSENGLVYNTAIPDEERLARNFLYTYCRAKITELEKLNVSLIDGNIKLDALYESIQADYSHFTIQCQAQIVTEGLTLGKVHYEGADGVFKFATYATGEFQRRESVWFNNNKNHLMVTTVEEYNKVNMEAAEDVYKLSKFHIPPFDDIASIMAGDMFVVIGDEGTGKTNYMMGVIVDLILQGHSVIVMAGESKKIKILNMVLSRFIFVTTGYKIKWDELLGDFSNINNDDVIAQIRDCAYKLFESTEYGKVHIVQRFTYSNYKDEVKSIIRQHPELNFVMIVVDHTGKLSRGEFNYAIGRLNDERSSINALFDQALDLKNELNMAHMMVAHTGSEAAKLIAQGNSDKIGTRIGAGSADTTKDADIVLHLEGGPVLSKKGLVLAVIKKFREKAIDLFKPVILKKDFDACNYIYTLSLQAELGVQDDKEFKMTEDNVEEMI